MKTKYTIEDYMSENKVIFETEATSLVEAV